MSTNLNPAYEAAVQMLLEFDQKETSLDQLVHLAILGIRKVEYHPNLLEVIIDDEHDGDDPTVQKLIAARDYSALATKELEQDFPLLHAQAVTTLWGALEAAMRNLFASLLENVPEMRKIEAYSKLKVRIADYEELEGLDRYLFLVDAIEQSLSTKQKTGIERFENLFNAFRLSSPVEPDVVKCLRELYLFRNVIVHRHSKVDKRLLTAMPWIDIPEGKELRVSHAQYHQYRTAISIYFFIIVNRLRTAFNMKPIQHAPDCRCKDHSFVYQRNCATPFQDNTCA